MMKIYKIFMLAFFLIVLSNFASAYVDATFDFNRNDVEVLAYNCNDADCNSVSPFSGYFDGGSTTTNGQVTVVFPSTLASANGYALFFFAPGMIPISGNADFHSAGNNGHYDVEYDITFEQVTDCQSVIDEFSVTNDVYANEPLVIDTSSSLDAKTASAFSEKDNGVGYIPPSMVSRYFSADVTVDLQITRNGVVVNTQQQNFDQANGNPIRMDEQADVHFSWTPAQTGEHTAIVRSTVTDAQCANNIQASSEKDFTVLPTRPTNECYTLLNTLDVNNSYPNVGELLEFTLTKISNHADGSHVLTPIPTDLNYYVYESGVEVDSGSVNLVANPNAVDAVEYSFTWTPTQSGMMSIVVDGMGNSGMCAGLSNYEETVRLNFNVREIPTFELDLQVVDSTTGLAIENVSIAIPSLASQSTDATGRTIFRDLNGNTDYTFTATHQDYVTHVDTVEIVDVSLMHRFTMDPIGNPGLTVTIDCFDEVVENHEQSCSAFVRGNGLPVGNANVDFTFENPTEVVSCTTDAISGGCVVERIETVLGTHTVDAVASAAGFDDGTDSFTYEVLRERYDIVNLRVFNDPAFTNEDYTFYRGEDMYVSFESLDTENANVHVQDLVSRVTLVSTPGGRADLTLISQGSGYYYYRLTPIPATHDFLGASQAFAFVFNFTDNSGGQEVVDLTILNNPPIIAGVIPDQTLYVAETADVDLSAYAYDLEDSANNLTWTVSGVDTSIATVTIDNNNIEIVGVAVGIDTITVTLTDLDGDSDSQDIVITVIDMPECSDTIDNDGDGLSDMADPGCHTDNDAFNVLSYNPLDDDETDVVTQCSDGIDNDGDGLADAADPGCHTDGNPADFSTYDPMDDDETDPILPECSDWIDNDGDGLADSADPGCHSDGNAMNPATYNPSDDDETDSIPPGATLTFDNAPPTHAWVLNTYTFDLDATSSLGGTLHFYAINAPASFTIDESTGVISWLALPQDLGVQTITLMVADGYVSTYLTWNVNVESRTNVYGTEDPLRNILNVMKIRFPETPTVIAGDTLSLTIVLENDGDFDQDNLRVSVMSYDFGVKRMIGPFDLDEGDSTTRTVYLDIPARTPAGEYDIRIVMKNDDITRIKHRPIRVI